VGRCERGELLEIEYGHNDGSGGSEVGLDLRKTFGEDNGEDSTIESRTAAEGMEWMEDKS
jgi:hypothetical protein